MNDWDKPGPPYLEIAQVLLVANHALGNMQMGKLGNPDNCGRVANVGIGCISGCVVGLHR